MKFTSRYALAAALGFGVAAVGVAAPAFAKDKKEATSTAPAMKLSDAFRKAAGPAQDALAKKDYAAADAAIAQARTVAKSPDEQYMVASYALNSEQGKAQGSGDQTKLAVALDELITTGLAANKLTDADKLRYYGFQGMFAYQAKNYPKVEQAYTAAMAVGDVNPQDYAVLADAQQRDGKPSEAIGTILKLVEIKAKTGEVVDSDYYARGVDIASRAKSPQEFLRISMPWLTAYPQMKNWHDVLVNYRIIAGTKGDFDTDILRFMRVIGVLPIGTSNNYVDYALAVYLKYPGEAVAVLREGLAAGKLTKTDKNTSEVLALSETKIAADKASLPGLVTQAHGPKATYNSIVTNGDVFYGYADYAKAAELYKLALTKAGADTNQGNVRLGAALAQSGNKEGARAAFNAVTSGPYLVLAGFWKTQLDHPAS